MLKQVIKVKILDYDFCVCEFYDFTVNKLAI